MLPRNSVGRRDPFVTLCFVYSRLTGILSKKQKHSFATKIIGGRMFETTNSAAQIGIFVSLTMLIAILTYWKVHGKGAQRAQDAGSTKEVFLAGGGLTWLFVAGSITLTNLSTEQLVGMNGNQMLLLAWWEIRASLAC
jgi:hypothetical protein